MLEYDRGSSKKLTYVQRQKDEKGVKAALESMKAKLISFPAKARAACWGRSSPEFPKRGLNLSGPDEESLQCGSKAPL